MEHQEQTFRRLIKNPTFLDFSDPGTGKTRSQVDIIAHLRAQGVGPALVVAPKTLLYSTWVREVEKWQPHLTCAVAIAGKREKAFEENADVYITNTDAATWLLKQKPDFFKRFDILVVDEISKFKNPQAKRTKALMALSRYFKFRYGLTGTPIPNTLYDIWSQAFIIDQGEHLGNHFYHFRGTTCDPKQVGRSPHAVQWTAKPGMLETVGQLLAPISIRHDFSLLNLPPNTLNVQAYKMSMKLRLQYEKLKKTAVLALKDDYIVGVNAATLLGKLLQVCTGTAYGELGDAVTLDTQRVDLVVELIKARQHSLVFFNYKHQRDALIAALEKQKKQKVTYCVIDGDTSDKMRDRYVDRFQRGMYTCMLAHPAAAAHGLTLTKATSTIWMSLTWNLEFWLQGNRRIHRKGQEKATETVVVIAEDTVESDVMEKLSAKDVSQQTVLDVLKELT
jgi:SNF2 family DNA or RNA helicase